VLCKKVLELVRFYLRCGGDMGFLCDICLSQVWKGAAFKMRLQGAGEHGRRTFQIRETPETKAPSPTVGRFFGNPREKKMASVCCQVHPISPGGP
jgi:hypothetical protein